MVEAGVASYGRARSVRLGVGGWLCPATEQPVLRKRNLLESYHTVVLPCFPWPVYGNAAPNDPGN